VEFNEATATQQEQETSVDDTTTTQSGPVDMYETGDVQLPPPTPTAHRAILTAITRFDAPNTGSVGVRQAFRSESNGMTYERTTWLPKPFAANVHISREELTALGTQEGKKQSYLQRFAETVHNSLGDAELDQLVNAAIATGRTPFSKNDYTDLDSYLAKLTELTSNIPVIITTKVEESEGFRPKLIVARVYRFDHDTTKIRQKFADAE